MIDWFCRLDIVSTTFCGWLSVAVLPAVSVWRVAWPVSAWSHRRRAPLSSAYCRRWELAVRWVRCRRRPAPRRPGGATRGLSSPSNRKRPARRPQTTRSSLPSNAHHRRISRNRQIIHLFRQKWSNNYHSVRPKVFHCKIIGKSS